MLALASSEFSRCRGMCLNFWHKWELTPSCLIYSGTSEMQLAPCSPILCWFWAFLGQGRLPAAMHSAAAFYWISGIKRNRNRWFFLKKNNLLLPLVLVQPYVSVGLVEWLSFSPGYSVPQNILTCIHGTAPSFPWVPSTGLHQWKETQSFSIVHFMNWMNYIHLASLWILVSGMSILLLEDKWNRLGEQQF